MAILLSVLFLLTTVVLSLLAVLFLWWIVLTVRTRKVIHHSSDSPHVFPHPALGESAVSLSESLRKGKYTSSELVSVFRKQIDRTTQVTNAVANRRYLQAKEEATIADACIASGDASAWYDAVGATDVSDTSTLPPFLGVPISIKECFAVTGLPQTSGLVSRKGVVADQDATAVSRLRAAGFIVMVNTNLSELCMWYESNNTVWGRTNNPYNPLRIVGGSSGGEGALVSSATPCGLGSDIGGSIRMPAFFNGVYGHKPTGGLVPGTGQYPIPATPGALRILTTGPLARHAVDLWPLLRILAGPDGKDVGCRAQPLSCSPRCVGGPNCRDCFRPSLTTPLPLPVSELVVYTINPAHVPAMTTPVAPDQVDAVKRVTKGLEAALTRARVSVRVEVLDMPDFVYANDQWEAMLHDAGAPRFADLLENGQPINYTVEFIKAIFGMSNFTVPALGLAIVEDLPHKLAPKRCKDFLERGKALKQSLEARLGSNAVLVCPTHPTTAPVHDMPLLRIPNFAYTAFFNAMELPVTAVPTGLSAIDGMPTGVQLVGGPGQDLLTIALANVLEKEIGGWVPPTIALAQQ